MKKNIIFKILQYLFIAFLLSLSVYFLFLDQSKNQMVYFLTSALLETGFLVITWLEKDVITYIYLSLSFILLLVTQGRESPILVTYFNLIVYAFLAFLVNFFNENIKNEASVNKEFIEEEKARYEGDLEKKSSLHSKKNNLEKQIENLEKMSSLLSAALIYKKDANVVNVVFQKLDLIFPNSILIYSKKSSDSDFIVTNKAGTDIDLIGKTIDSFANFVYKTKLPLLIDDFDLYIGQSAERNFLQDYKSIMAVPVFLQHNEFGVLSCYRKSKKSFESQDIRLLQYIGDIKSNLLGNIALYNEIKRLAKIDGITGLYVQRAFFERMSQEMFRAKKHKSSFTLLVIDIDNFKKFNDSYGHQIGDIILVKVAQTIKNSIRKNDFPSRYGGDEFFIILPETKIKGALVLAERIRSKVVALSSGIKQDNGLPISPISISAGVGEFKTKYNNYKEFIQVVDDLLYKAKKRGKNCIVTEDEASS